MDRNGNIEMKRILDILKSKVLLVILILLVFAMFGYMYSYYYVVPEYKSTETLLLIPNNTSEESMITSTDLTLNSGLITTYSDIAKQSRVLKQVIKNLNLNMTEKQLLNKIKVNVVTDTYVIEITVSDANPEMAKDIAEELSNVFLKEIKEIYNLENLGIVDRAEIENIPYNINHIKDIIMFIAAGIVLSGMIIVCIYLFDNTVKTEEDIEVYAEIKTLGKIPMNADKKNEIMSKSNSKSYVTECINTIRTNILYMNSIKSAKTILVTSCKAQEGKSWVSANIAATFAETGKKVLLIDADMRKGRANKIFKVNNTEGLSNYLYFMTGDIKEDLELAKKYVKTTDIPNLHILTNGTIPPNPSELLDSNNMKELIAIFKNTYDVIIVDAPPSMLVTDSIVLSTIIDSTVLVVNSEKTKINDLIGVRKSIEIVGGNIIGAILNKVKMGGKVYSKGYYYGHTEKENKCEVKTRELISVNEVIEAAKKRLEEKEYNIFEEIKLPITTNTDKETVEEDIVEVEDTQSKYFNKIINTVSDIKRQINRNSLDSNNEKETSKAYIEDVITRKLSEFRENSNLEFKEEIQALNYANELNKISNEIKNIKYADELNKISEKIENINANFNDIEYKDEIEAVYNEIKSIKEDNNRVTRDEIEEIVGRRALTKEEIEQIVSSKALTRDEIEEIVGKRALTKEEIEQIVSSKALTRDEIEEIVGKRALTKEEIEQIVSSKALTRDEIEEIVGKRALTKEEIEQIVSSKALTRDEIEEIVGKRALTKEEIEQIVSSKALTRDEIEEIVGKRALTKEEIEQIVSSKALTRDEIEEIVGRRALTKEEIEQIVSSKALTRDEIEEIVGRRALTKEEIEQIVSSKALTRDEIEEIVGRRALTKEEVEAIVRKQMLTREQIESIVGSKSITKEEIENVVKKEKLGKEEIQNIIKNEMLNIDYTRQLKQIEEMIAGLKDNYLELSNKLNIQEEHEVECSDVEKPDNIIDIKELKKAKKRKAYSIKEDILFSDLEETAYCVIPFGSNSEEANKRKAAKG